MDGRKTLDEKLGAMLVAGFDGQQIGAYDAICRYIQEDHLGGVILYGTLADGTVRNIASPAQTAELTAQLRGLAPYPLIVSTDWEGGCVTPLDGSGAFPKRMSSRRLGGLDAAQTYQFTANVASTLKAMGVNLNYAPGVDVDVNPENPIIGRVHRSFSSDPEVVTAMGEASIRAHHDNGVLTTLKHFPGHGSSTADSHLGFVDVTETWMPMELGPFRNIIKDGLADAIMTAHVFNAQIDDEYPATLSKKTITGLLREQMGYEGVVITDAMEMKAISAHYGLEESVRLAVEAGNDIILYSGIGFGDQVREVLDAFKRLVEEGTVTEARIEESWRRIGALRMRMEQLR